MVNMKSKEITKEQLLKLIQKTFGEMQKTLDNAEWARLREYYSNLKKLYETME